MNNNTKGITKKLNVRDYVFEIDGKDIYNLELKYYVVEKIIAHYVNGHVE